MAGRKSRKENAQEGEAFLAKNKEIPGVMVTASGLQYEVLREGTGPAPKRSHSVKVHYLGTLVDGTKFDSSYDRKEPIVFPVSGVIEGWVEGLQLMNAGSKFRFVIPSELAYGSGGAGEDIGPDSVLVFEVELLEILGR
jgi:FKBP-type peptidyl-prolyl cis-trans isomerase